MKKNYFAKLISALIICIALPLAIFAGCTVPDDAPKSFIVKFDSNGGSSVPQQTVESGKTVSEPADPTRDGYEFESWLDIDNNEYDFTKAVTKDFTLFAKWNPKSVTPELPQTKYYTVTFDSDGGSAVKPASVEEGKKVTKPDDPTRDGYKFDGWFEDGSTTAYDFTKPVTDDFTLTAKWTKKSDPSTNPPETKNYTVTFDSDGGSAVKPASVEEGKTVTKPDDPTRDGYTFDKWTLNGTAFGFDTPITKNIELVATWTKNPVKDPSGGDEIKYYTVNFNSNQGSAVSAQYVESGKKAAEPTAPVKDGFIFDGWYKESTFTNKYSFDTAVTENLTLHAKWSDDNVTTYTVTFNSNGGSEVVKQEVARGGTATLPKAPEKANFVFDGWYLDNARYEFDTPVTSDITLTAKWTAAEAEETEYEVTFDSDGGSEVAAQIIEENGKAVEPKDPTKTGYTFGGWYVGSTAYNFDTAVTSDLTLTAKWTKSVTLIPKTDNFVYNYDNITNPPADKTALSQDNFTGGNSFLIIADAKVTYRHKDTEGSSSPNCIENTYDGISVTFKGTGNITIKFSSTGGSNTSSLELRNENEDNCPASETGNKISEGSEGSKVYVITGTTADTITFTITEAGTYTIYCWYVDPADSTKKRGARITNITMTDTYMAEE